MQTFKPQPSNILWTGGWDSTFRVIQLVRQGYKVRPHYIVDSHRQSTYIEIKTISKISEILNKNYGPLILEPKISEYKDLIRDTEIENAYEKIREVSYLGSQYVMIASYCKQFNISNLELCIHKDDRAFDHIAQFVQKNRDGRYSLKNDSPSHVSQLFSYFCFPILNLTKLDMQKFASDWGVEDIMELTWFCHTPFLSKPCGTCYPCMYTINEGLARRFSKVALIRYRSKLELRKYPRLIDRAQRMLKYFTPNY